MTIQVCVRVSHDIAIDADIPVGNHVIEIEASDLSESQKTTLKKFSRASNVDGRDVILLCDHVVKGEAEGYPKIEVQPKRTATLLPTPKALFSYLNDLRELDHKAWRKREMLELDRFRTQHGDCGIHHGYWPAPSSATLSDHEAAAISLRMMIRDVELKDPWLSGESAVFCLDPNILERLKAAMTDLHHKAQADLMEAIRRVANTYTTGLENRIQLVGMPPEDFFTDGIDPEAYDPTTPAATLWSLVLLSEDDDLKNRAKACYDTLRQRYADDQEQQASDRAKLFADVVARTRDTDLIEAHKEGVLAERSIHEMLTEQVGELIGTPCQPRSDNFETPSLVPVDTLPREVIADYSALKSRMKHCVETTEWLDELTVEQLLRGKIFQMQEEDGETVPIEWPDNGVGYSADIKFRCGNVDGMISARLWCLPGEQLAF